MSALALFATEIPMVNDLTLLADNPADMLVAQKGLINWCERKIAACDAERVEAASNGARAVMAGWDGEEKRWNRVAKKARLKVEFYNKVKLALEAGYYIVPPFPGQVFAIRTKKAAPNSERRYHSRRNSSDHEQSEQTLPAGEGEYRNPFPAVQNETDRYTGKDGKEVVQKSSYSTDWVPMEFPIALAKPEILTATNKALAGKFFDRLSVLPRWKSPDPIVMGEINVPHRKGERVAFFVAWWLDTRTL